jgi:hypothetical protein
MKPFIIVQVTRSIAYSVYDLEKELIRCSMIDYEAHPDCAPVFTIIENGQEIEVPLPGNGQVWFVGSFAGKQARMS